MMGLFKMFLGYTVAKHLLETTRPQPVNINLDLHIQLPDDKEDDDIDLCMDNDSLSTADVPDANPSSLPAWDENGRWLMDERGFPVTQTAN